jgi:hypothetical protein
LDQLSAWGQPKYGNISKKINKLQLSLDAIKKTIPTQNNTNQIKAMEASLDDLLKQEELWWSQRAKVHWLKHGDLNTKYFHYKANQRKRKNTIHSIQDSSGSTWQDSDKIQSIFINHFQNIFKSSTTQDNQDIYNVVKNRISPNDFSVLNTDFTSK